ncbi:unnamed protein product [Bursaphelenchus okinawaensis]|uniref:Uncharacterized protein n=1 Tax=Bursaphelenchus okinawaensis TaxID=465554 RepID=A0A811KC58_9BILA|nr:unnamed protein product [Bursaphelenchus okinawaensis]CAG9100717.1 unnamed protein product [Bursaphelenchus okinawaensis]
MTHLFRSRSLDLSHIPRGERYLSRWSRENTPVDPYGSYSRSTRRSFTPVRETAGYQKVHDYRRAFSEDPQGAGSLTGYRRREPLAYVHTPYHANYGYYTENQPIRKYDVFQLRTWSYPIHKYLYGRDTHHDRPYSYNRDYANTPKYTPPTMTAEQNSLTQRRGYSGYNYISGGSYDVAAKPWSLSNYRTLRAPHVTSASWYWHGRSSLRHYNSYRPPTNSSRLSTYWKPYF